MIQIKVDGSVVSVQETEALYCGSQDVYTCCFTFGTGWEKFSKSAVFRVGEKAITAVIDEENKCILPWELLVRGNIGEDVKVGVYGISSDEEIITGVWDSLGMVRQGSELGNDAREPSAGVYEQVMANVQRVDKKIVSYSEEARSLTQRAESAAAVSQAQAERTDENAAAAMRNAEVANNAKNAVVAAIENLPVGSTVVINDLTTGGTAAALSAEMGRVLAQRPNPNLLHNGYFANPVNQRGETSVPGYSATAPYFIDRWKRVGYSSGVLTLENGLIIDGSATANGQNRLSQILETVLPSGKYTLSILIESLEGTAVIQFCDSSFNTLQTTTIQETGLTSVTLESDAIRGVNFGVNTRSVARFKAIKLELGDTQTLAHQDSAGNWVLNEIPDYSEELVKCQRYQMVYKFINTGMYFLAHADSTTNAYVSVFTPSVMRSVTPTITADTSQLVLRSSTNTSNEISGISHYTTSGNMTVLRITSSDLTPGENYQLRANGASELIIDRNL